MSYDDRDAEYMLHLTRLRDEHDRLQQLIEWGEDEEGREVWLLEGYSRRRPAAIYDVLDALGEGPPWLAASEVEP
jgi:hypothetical protein